jgi:hypothetical protein
MSLKPDIEITIENKPYKVSVLTQEIQDKFGTWVEQVYWKVLRHSRKDCNDDEYNHLLSEHQHRKVMGAFELVHGSESMKYLLNTVDGYRQFMYLCFRRHCGITPAELNDLMERNSEQFKDCFLQIMSSKKNSPKEVVGNS